MSMSDSSIPSTKIVSSLFSVAAKALLFASLCGRPVMGFAAPPPAVTAPNTNPATPPVSKQIDPVAERAQAIREAASLLEKAGAALERGNKNFAEQLFSSAEIIVGPEALSELAPRFREGAPPRVTTPLKVLPKNTPAQPLTVGNSDEEEPDAKPKKGSLSGVVEVDGKPGEGLGVVTLEPKNGKFKHRTAKQRVMEQRDRQFAPRVLVVPVGSTVAFPNFDPVYHNVFSSSEARPFDLGIYKGGQSREMTFDKEGVLALGCNLHANMSAHIVVVGAPHYVITDDKGRFSFRSLEPGTYTMRVWNERTLAPWSQDVVIKADKNSLSVKLKGDAPSGPSPDKFGNPRGKRT